MLNRRNFLVSSSAFGLNFQSNNIAFSQTTSDDDKSVIFLFLSGGASHIETFNPIPDAPVEYRSVTGHVNTKTAGMKLGGLFKNLAKQSDSINIVRSFAHRDGNHASASHWLMTGEPNFGAGTTQKWPSYGSVTTGIHGTTADNGLPIYVKIDSLAHDSSAWMGGKFTGYNASKEGRKDLQLLGRDAKFKNRLEILSFIENNYKHKDNNLARSWNDLKEQAVEVILGDASKAFKVEKDLEFEGYKANPFGTNILTAIRLIESGSKFVTLNFGGWDMHNNIQNSLNNRQVVLDQYLAKMIQSLKDRGLSKKVLLVVTSEFGRTPKININAGRDHFSKQVPLLLSGGDFESGRVIGQSTSLADGVDDSLFEPEDLKFTIFSHLGIKKSAGWTGIDGRPHNFTKETAKNILLP